MLPYILVAFFLLILAVHFDIKGYIKRREHYIKIATWGLILFSGLRNELGIDTYSYAIDYETAPLISDVLKGSVDWLDFSTQPLWKLFMSLCKTLSNNFVLMQMIVAFVFNTLMVRFLKNTTDKVFVCMLVFFCTRWYNYNFEILRESICVVLFLNGLVDYCKTGKNARFLLFCIPAIFIHWFAAFMLIFFVVVNKANWKLLFWASVVLAILFLFLNNRDFSNALNSSLVLIGSHDDKLNGYMVRMYNGFNQNFYIRLAVTSLMPTLILIMIYLTDKNKTHMQNLLIKYLPIYLVFCASTSRLVIAYRLSNYIYPIFLVLAINALSNVYLKKGKRVKFNSITNGNVLTVSFLLFFCLNIYSDTSAFLHPANEYQRERDLDIRYFPYTSVFEEPNEERTQYYLFWRNWQ